MGELVTMRSGCCPCCGGTDVDGGVVEITTRGAEQECRCYSCGTSWVDVYRLVNQVAAWRDDR